MCEEVKKAGDQYLHQGAQFKMENWETGKSCVIGQQDVLNLGW